MLLSVLPGLHLTTHQVVALGHRAPHARILWAQQHGALVVEQGVVVQASEAAIITFGKEI